MLNRVRRYIRRVVGRATPNSRPTRFVLVAVAAVVLVGIVSGLYVRRSRILHLGGAGAIVRRAAKTIGLNRLVKQARTLLPHRNVWHVAAADPVPRVRHDDEHAGFVIFERSTLVRIHQDSKPRNREHLEKTALSAAWEEYVPLQLGVFALRDLRQLHMRVSDLQDDERHVIASSNIQVRMERYYAVPLSISKQGQFGVVPKTLEVATPIDVDRGATRGFWITVHVPAQQPAGIYHGAIEVADASASQLVAVQVEVIPISLEEPDILYGPLSLTVLRNLSAQRRPARRQAMLWNADVIFRDLREHGMNTMSLWSGRFYREWEDAPQLDDLDAALDLYKKYGFTKPLIYAPVNLLNTNKINRSSNYRSYNSGDAVAMAQKIARHYTKRARTEGLPGIIFDPIEEPNLRSGIAPGDPVDIRQRIAAELLPALKAAGATTAMTCTPESVRAVADDVDYWLVAYQRFTPQVYTLAAQHHARLALYANATLMGNGTYFSRFMFGYFAWANQLRGVLAWTYPSVPKRFPTNVDGRGEGGRFVVNGFLGIDGKPIPTIQWELVREGIDDAKYLATIESLLPRARALGTPAAHDAVNQAEGFLNQVRTEVQPDPRRYVFENPTTFEPEPSLGWDARRFEDTRTESARLIKQLLALGR